MKFNNAAVVESIVWQMRLSEWPRAANRSRINALANGEPPFDVEEARQNGDAVNFNDLSLTRAAHDARAQLYQAFNKPGQFFSARTDYGAVARRQERGVILSREASRVMKNSLRYFEAQRSKFAQTVLHGIGPVMWEDDDYWCARPVGVEDLLIPGGTFLSFDNLPYFARWRAYTALELYEATHRPRRDPGWNMDAVRAALKWADRETARGMGASQTADYWTPEKWRERYKEDSGLYASDRVPTVDVFDFYYRGDDGGWCRRVIFDEWAGSGRYRAGTSRPDGIAARNSINGRHGRDSRFLYSSGDRAITPHLDQRLHFQFADLSAVAPFRYHSVRSLGFLLYAVCHLQNRLRCRFSDAVFENLLMYLRVRSLDDAERSLQVNLYNRAVIDESVSFLNPAERWQPNFNLAELGLSEFKQLIADSSGAFTQDRNFSRDRVEKTKFQVMAEVNAMTTLISSALQQAYVYQKQEYIEDFRRLLRPNSADPAVRSFRQRVLAAGVPEKLLAPECWDIEPERIMGAGNKTMEMAIAQQLWEMRAAYPPQSQSRLLRDITLAVTDDAARTLELVPEAPEITRAQHDAMMAFGALMAGGLVKWPPSHNGLEVAATLLAELEMALEQTPDFTTLERSNGLANVALHVSGLLESVAGDEAQRPVVRSMQDGLMQLSNAIRGLQQRAQEQAAAGNGDGEAALTAAKLAAEQVKAQTKADNTRDAHMQRTAQRQVAFEMEQQREDARAAADLRRKEAEAALKLSTQQDAQQAKTE